MSETNHGEILPQVPKPKRVPLLPRCLRQGVIDINMPHAEGVAKWGLWKMKALKPTNIARTRIEPGDTFKCAGNVAFVMVMTGDAEIIDAQLDKEREALSVLDSIMPQRLRDALRTQREERGNFVTAPLHQDNAA